MQCFPDFYLSVICFMDYLSFSVNGQKGKQPYEVSHFRALCSALSETVGMGNVAGVAVAITQGGPGALFWMWVCAVLGMATKFYTCSLAVMYRGKDEDGVEQGGPMYFITHGLGERWRPMAVFFAVCGMFGCLPLLQSNQLTQIVRSMFFEPNGWFVENQSITQGNALFGLLLAIMVGFVVIGGIKRIGAVAARLVPVMVVLYGGSALLIIFHHLDQLGWAFSLIFTDAFTGQAVAGGAIGVVIVTGVRRAAFSNEAGMGTEAMAHGAAKTKEPIREGLVAMWGPVIDTLLMCSLTGLVLLVTGVWQSGEGDGVLLTTAAFEQALPGLGSIFCLPESFVLVSLPCWDFLTMWSNVCFLFGQRARIPVLGFYLFAIIISSVATLSEILNFLDIAFGLMAIPTILSSILLAPKVNRAAKSYF